MRRPGWIALVLALTTLSGSGRLTLGAEPPKPEKIALGNSPAYKALGKLPLMHEGRIKPLDTVARQEISLIYTRETITLTSPDGKTITTWSPVAALVDWPVRPKFWDDQRIIAVEYLPLKRLLLADEIKSALEAVTGKAATSEEDRKRIKDLINKPEIEASDLRSLVKSTKLDEADALAIENLSKRVGEETRYLTPNELETADVTIDGKKMPFQSWVEGLSRRKPPRGSVMSDEPVLSELERKAFEVAVKLKHYREIRDKEPLGLAPLLAMPRPANQAMLAFSGKALAKAVETQGRDLSPLALEAAGNLNQHYQDIDIKDRAEPGTNSQFDKKYTKWLREKSAWVPLGVIREASIDELALAGYPTDKVEAFRTAFKAMEDEELANPGRASEKPALALIQAATDLGTAVNDYYYPTQTAMAREVSFNELAPFFRAPWAYGLAFLAFIFSMISTDFGKSMKLETVFGGLAKVLYGVGFIGFGAGIAFEVVGFYLRINITGWAPVTNMYETVIWVGLVSAVLGLILEAVYQKTWAALAGSGVGLVCTALAATVPLLDPQIKMLPPVLRSNFWLSIHVLTIVSSYAAFALAMVLGMAATTLYLTATYKRSASFLELAKPMVTGLPLLAVGILGYFASYGHFGAGEIVQTHGFWPSVAIGCVGSTITASAAFAILGELLNRLIFRKQLGEVVESPVYDPFATPASVAESASTSEARQLAMQGTAAMIKPVANFIYRSIQVGILLVTAGTFLGGWWADVSWGRFWGWDPKEVSALITLLVYLVPLHGRFAGWFNTFSLVMASVVCFLSVLMAWYGVNFVLGVGLHSYGFGTNAGQGYVGVATLIVLSYAMGTAWRRHVSQNVSLIVT